ncbi:steroid 17-alpha-hydroxylase/17,20 lyase-like [Mercenaria mercenaria]|uniref:steroid 17-alpha-hydroxylase/17,20 lyase-like n=1 Tax=Mercenaria mercenaria TaxID=6596 RepID=UPI00234E4362|nr:steroid 17-alpha-hydroxylase/17,20 lyase-like [Mercenaria mercenaria]
MSLVGVLARCILAVLSFLQCLLPHRKGTIPEAGFILNKLLDLLFEDDNLLKLEFLTDFYEDFGLFRFDNKIYIFDQKLTQTVINKLEKGAQDYLENSPLKDTILGSTNRSPEVRRAIATIFRKSVLEEKGNLIIKDVEKLCDNIAEEANAGQLVNVTDWSLRMAMDVVGHMLLQLDMHALEGQQQLLLECLMTILHRCYALGEITADSKEFKEANDKFEKLTTKILADALKIEDHHDEKRLVVKLHEACGFDLARDNMKLFLMAGSETTAATIPVLLYLLTTYTDVQEELRAEANENIDALYKDPSLALPKLEAVLKEVLRVYPIAPFISRQTLEEVNVGDFTFEANTDIKAFTWGIHRSKNQWSKSKEFIPFRFLDNSSRVSSKMYIPFGAGSRVCIGQHLAWLELKIATAVMLHRFNISKIQETRTLRFVTDWAHAVVHPDKDLLFRFEVR